MSNFIKRYPRAKVSRHPNLNGWVIDLIQRPGAKPKRVAATYSTIAWADRAARAKFGIKLGPLPAPQPVRPAPRLETPAPAAAAPVGAAKPVDQGHGTCTPCGRPMRAAGSKATDHPGTTLRQRESLCQTCYQRQKREAPEASATRKKGESVEEDVAFLVDSGASRDEIAERIGTSWANIERQLYRRGRGDLVTKAVPKDPEMAAAVRKARVA